MLLEPPRGRGAGPGGPGRLTGHQRQGRNSTMAVALQCRQGAGQGGVPWTAIAWGLSLGVQASPPGLSRSQVGKHLRRDLGLWQSPLGKGRGHHGPAVAPGHSCPHSPSWTLYRGCSVRQLSVRPYQPRALFAHTSPRFPLPAERGRSALTPGWMTWEPLCVWLRWGPVSPGLSGNLLSPRGLWAPHHGVLTFRTLQPECSGRGRCGVPLALQDRPPAGRSPSLALLWRRSAGQSRGYSFPGPGLGGRGELLHCLDPRAWQPSQPLSCRRSRPASVASSLPLALQASQRSSCHEIPWRPTLQRPCPDTGLTSWPAPCGRPCRGGWPVWSSSSQSLVARPLRFLVYPTCC